MGSTINTNIASLNAQRNLMTSQNALSTSLQRLSSGLRINSAKDDAAGLAISERMTAQIRGMAQAERNANDGVSLAQTGESALGQMGTLLQRIRELAVQSANGTNTASDRQSLNQELSSLTSELNRFATSTQFNGVTLFDGNFSSASFQVGANANQVVSATSANFKTDSYGTQQQLSVYSAVIVSGAASGTLNNATFASGTNTINGGYGSGTFTTTTTSSAKDVAASINLATQTGVRAMAKNQFDVALTSGKDYNLQVTGSNTTAVAVSFSVGSTGTTSTDLSAAVAAFNNRTSQTGITAKLNSAGTGITLTALDGSNVALAQDDSASGSITISANGDMTGAIGGTSTGLGSGTGALTITGQVTLDSDRSFSIVGTTASSGLFDSSVTDGKTSASTSKAVSDLDISTLNGANLAIRVADSAITAINNQRAAFGALQNRFAATISNLQAGVENVSAARSRIQDTDFASETANLTRNQILQQAGTAMLAQANALPQQVLSLLK